MTEFSRDQLDALIDAQGFTVNMCPDPGCRAEHEVLEISDLLAILAVVPPEHEIGKPLCVRCWAYLTCPVCKWPAPARALEIVKQLEQWDMLTLRENGFGMATADAPWALDLLAELRSILGRAAAPEPPTPDECEHQNRPELCPWCHPELRKSKLAVARAEPPTPQTEEK
jgi:hypothetical protein